MEEDPSASTSQHDKGLTHLSMMEKSIEKYLPRSNDNPQGHNNIAHPPISINFDQQQLQSGSPRLSNSLNPQQPGSPCLSSNLNQQEFQSGNNRFSSSLNHTQIQPGYRPPISNNFNPAQHRLTQSQIQAGYRPPISNNFNPAQHRLNQSQIQAGYRPPISNNFNQAQPHSGYHNDSQLWSNFDQQQFHPGYASQHLTSLRQHHYQSKSHYAFSGSLNQQYSHSAYYSYRHRTSLNQPQFQPGYPQNRNPNILGLQQSQPGHIGYPMASRDKHPVKNTSKQEPKSEDCENHITLDCRQPSVQTHNQYLQTSSVGNKPIRRDDQLIQCKSKQESGHRNDDRNDVIILCDSPDKVSSTNTNRESKNRNDDQNDVIVLCDSPDKVSSTNTNRESKNRNDDQNDMIILCDSPDEVASSGTIPTTLFDSKNRPCTDQESSGSTTNSSPSQTSHQETSDVIEDETMIAQRVLPFCAEKHRKNLICLRGPKKEGEATFVMFSDSLTTAMHHESSRILPSKDHQEENPSFAEIDIGTNDQNDSPVVLLQKDGVWRDPNTSDHMKDEPPNTPYVEKCEEHEPPWTPIGTSSTTENIQPSSAKASNLESNQPNALITNLENPQPSSAKASSHEMNNQPNALMTTSLENTQPGSPNAANNEENLHLDAPIAAHLEKDEQQSKPQTSSLDKSTHVKRKRPESPNTWEDRQAKKSKHLDHRDEISFNQDDSSVTMNPLESPVDSVAGSIENWWQNLDPRLSTTFEVEEHTSHQNNEDSIQSGVRHSKRKRNPVSYQLPKGSSDEEDDETSDQDSDYMDYDNEASKCKDKNISKHSQPKQAQTQSRDTTRSQVTVIDICDANENDVPQKKKLTISKKITSVVSKPVDSCTVVSNKPETTVSTTSKPNNKSKGHNTPRNNRSMKIFPLGQTFEADHRRINEQLCSLISDPCPCTCGRVFKSKVDYEDHLKSNRVVHPQDVFHILIEVDEAGKERSVVSELFNLCSSGTWDTRSPSVSFECRLCRKTFANVADGVAHIGRTHLKSSYMMCESCESVLCDGVEYQRHMTHFHSGTSVSALSLLPCSLCTANFHSEDKLLEHLQESHQDPFKCKTFTCRYRCASLSKLLEHEVCHGHRHGQCVAQCPVCGKVDAEQHIGTHILSEHAQLLPIPTDKSFINQRRKDQDLVKCGFCKEIMNVYELQRHRIKKLCPKVRVDSASRQWTCEVCSRTFHNFYAFRLHATTRHTDEYSTYLDGFSTHGCQPVHWPLSTYTNKILCELCSTITSLWAYQQHCIEQHMPGTKKSTTCDVCFQSVSTERMLQHKRYHVRTKTVTNFPKSVRLFDTSLTFNADLRSALGGNLSECGSNYICTVCGDRFEDEDSLKKHSEGINQTLQHPQHIFHFIKGTGSDGQEQSVSSPFTFLEQTKPSEDQQQAQMESFKCGVCESSFSSMEETVHHIGRIHYECPYMYCDLCGTMLMNQDTYSSHVLKFHKDSKIDHKNITPCSYCPKNCESKDACKNHIKTSHADSANICSVCKYVSMSKKEHLLHMFCHNIKSYHTKLELQEQCPVCGKIIQYEELGGHILEMHGKSNKLGSKPKSITLTRDQGLLMQCGFCDKDELTLSEMFVHRGSLLCPAVIKPRSNSGYWICQKCKKFVRTYHEWILHAMVEHVDKCSVISVSETVDSRNEYRRGDNDQPQLPFELGSSRPGESPNYQTQSRNNASPAPKSLMIEDINYQFPVIWPGCSGQCPVCGLYRKFGHIKTLESHVLSHVEKQQVVCEHCGFITSSTYHLKSHIANKHSKDMVDCKVCGKRLSKKGMVEHEKIHKEKPKKQCPYCNEYFPKLLVHINRKHQDGTLYQKLHKCSICNWEKVCSRMAYLVHKKSHDSTNDRVYECPVCKKEFKNRVLWNCHKKSHDERKFVCDLCGMKFHQRCTLTRHMTTHTKERPYKCSWCPESFPQSYPLSKHVKSRHPEEYDSFIEKDARRMKRK